MIDSKYRDEKMESFSMKQQNYTNDVMKETYERYRSDAVDTFFTYCTNVIQNWNGKPRTKIKFLEKLARNKTSKFAMYKIITNFVFENLK